MTPLRLVTILAFANAFHHAGLWVRLEVSIGHIGVGGAAINIGLWTLGGLLFGAYVAFKRMK